MILMSFLYLTQSQAQSKSNSLLEAKKIYNKLTGKFLNPTSQLSKDMVVLIENNNLKESARLAASESSFVNAVVRNWSANLISKNQEPLMSLNDSLAFMMGAVRDNLNAKSLLVGDFSYGIHPKFNKGVPKVSDNVQYDFIDDGVKEVGLNLYKYSPQWNNAKAKDPAGVLTSRYWSGINYKAGTNRRAVVNTLEVFLCKPNSSWKKVNLPTYRIRQDIDRFPTGNPKTFHTDCRSCHSVMDAMAGAFAKIDYKNESLDWSETVQTKYLHHNDVYPDGYVTTDTSWINFIDDPDGSWGWKTVKSGIGMNQLGVMLSETEAFKNCMVKTVFKSVCGFNLESTTTEFKNIVKNWENQGMGFLDLFLNVAVSPECK